MFSCKVNNDGDVWKMKAGKPSENFAKLRKDFPILSRKIHGKQLVYLDNAATSQKPIQVIDAMTDYYRLHNSNVNRSIHTLADEATQLYEKAHERAAKFINARHHEEIVFTKNTTESLNLAAYSLVSGLKKGDEIVLSQMEHHSSIVPFQQMAKKVGAKLKFIEIAKDGTLDDESIKKSITKKTKIVSVMHVSNVLGTINPIRKISKIARENEALMVVDGAQAAPHMPVDVLDLDADLYAFSGHKMLAPTGIGVLYGKRHILESMQPFLYGGHMIREVTFEDSTFNVLPHKFEAGTMNIAEAVGLSAAIDYLEKIGMDKIWNYDAELADYAMKRMKELKWAEVYGPKQRSAVISFNVKGIHPHDVAQVLDSEGIAIRAGHHCCMPLMKVMGVNATARASFYFYNTKDEVDRLIGGLHKLKKIFV
jgi:cysteine desulfurase / selenocysteine lyase